MNDSRYPIGRFEPIVPSSPEMRKSTAASIADFAAHLRDAVSGLEEDRLERPYRDGGWTVRQVVHHLADADMNAYLRFKKGLTEESPIAGTFREDLWAELSDYRDVPVGVSIVLVELIRIRLLALLPAMREEDFERIVVSPCHGEMTLDVALQRFDWHGRHHLAQIRTLKERLGW